jgi:hypothetical protein
MATMFGGSGMWDTGSFYTRWFTDSGRVAAIELSALAKDLLSALGRP